MKEENIKEFYLISDDIKYEKPIKCTFIRRIKSDFRDDFLLAAVDPKMTMYSATKQVALDKILLAPRFKGETFFPFSEEQPSAYIMQLLNEDAVKTGYLKDNDFKELDKGSIYFDKSEAEKDNNEYGD